jgi:hypothetical protein
MQDPPRWYRHFSLMARSYNPDVRNKLPTQSYLRAHVRGILQLAAS